MYISIVSPTFCKLMSVFIEVEGITIWPFVISRSKMADYVERHEAIHAMQQLEVSTAAALPLLIVVAITGWWHVLIWPFLPFTGPYYILYSSYWIAGLISGKSQSEAYAGIPFETEAYRYESEDWYISVRPWFAWAYL